METLGRVTFHLLLILFVVLVACLAIPTVILALARELITDRQSQLRSWKSDPQWDSTQKAANDDLVMTVPASGR
jgi:hypothetical protein